MRTQAMVLAALLGAAGCVFAAGNGHGGGAMHGGFRGGDGHNGGFRDGGFRGHDGFHRHFHHGGAVFIEGGFWWPWPYYPVYVGQATVFYDLGQPVWYYCANPPGYYPYVGSCMAPWQHVPVNPVVPPDQP